MFTIHPTEDDRVYLDHHKIVDAKPRRRVLIERLVIREAVKRLLSKGYLLQLTRVEGPLSQRTDQWQEIMKRLQSCDEEFLHVYQRSSNGFKLVGTILFVYGNDGWDVMADLSIWVGAELSDVNKLADKLADSHVVEGS